MRERVLFHSDTLEEVITLKPPPMGVPSIIHELRFTLVGIPQIVKL